MLLRGGDGEQLAVIDRTHRPLKPASPPPPPPLRPPLAPPSLMQHIHRRSRHEGGVAVLAIRHAVEHGGLN